jgi:hypothetical protein
MMTVRGWVRVWAIGLVLLAASVVPPGCRSIGEAAPAFVVTGPAGEKRFDVVAGTRVVLRTRLRDVTGPTSRPVFVSRAPDVVSVDSGGAVRGISAGRAFVVASVTEDGRMLMDSVEVTVDCTAELRVHTFPRDTVIRVGEAFVPRAELASCGGHVRLDDVLTWRARDAAVVRVDSVSGRTVGLAPGDTWVEFTGRKYGRFEGVHVRVVRP